MSASTEKKNRQAARQAGTDKKMIAAQEAEKKARATRRKWIIGTIAVVLCIALVLFLSSPILYRITTAETIGTKNYSPADVKYAVASAKTSMNYDLYVSYLGQETADQILENSVASNMIQTSALLQYAKENGISLNAMEKSAAAEAVDAQLAQIAQAAKTYNVSASTYMGYLYGNGVNRSVILNGLQDSILANKVYLSRSCAMDFTREELDAYSAGLDANGDLFSYAFYQVPVSEERTEEEAKAAAEALKTGLIDSYEEGADAQQLFNDLVAEEFPETSATVRNDVTGDKLDELYHDWIEAEERKAGDVEIFPAADNAGWITVLFLGRDDNSETVVQVRHILIKAEADEKGLYSDEAKAAAKARAEEILADWEAGDKSEFSFASMAFLYSEDSGSNTNGGLYSSVKQGQMVEEFDRFCFEEHNYGDTAIVYGESGAYAGYHIMFYVGNSTARDAAARDALTNEAMSAWMTELTEGLEPVYRWAYKLAK